jgi:hypothetical protein
MRLIDPHVPDDTSYAVLALLGLVAIVIAAIVLVIGSGRTPPSSTMIVSLGVPIATIVALVVARGWHRGAQ